MNVIDIKRIRMRRKAEIEKAISVNSATQASRLRYIVDYLDFLAAYVGATLDVPLREKLALESTHALKAFHAHVPQVSNRAKLGVREGLSREDQDKLLKMIHPESPDNPRERVSSGSGTG